MDTCPRCGSHDLDTHGTFAECPWCGWKDEPD
jgi:DNA-directed RNA polymerase subunit RPC12/RpoP